MVSQQVKVVSIKKFHLSLLLVHLVCANVLNNDSLSGVSSEDEDEKCCVCGKFTPNAVRYSESVM